MWPGTSWENLIRILSTGILCYVGLLLLLRLTGNRTLSQMNSFDFIITIAMGSTFSSGLMQESISVSDTLIALLFLAGSQFVITFIGSRSRRFKNFVTSEPILLFYDGQYLEKSMLRARVNKDEILASIRLQGISKLNDVEAVLLETNGSLSVLRRAESEKGFWIKEDRTYTPNKKEDLS